MTEALLILAALVFSFQTPSPAIRGTVFDAANHQALSDAGIVLKNMDTGKYSYATTDGTPERSSMTPMPTTRGPTTGTRVSDTAIQHTRFSA